ncbi:MAG: DUF3810 family protein, partial [Clostridia bacterium]
LIIVFTLVKSSKWISEHIFTKGVSRAYIYFVGHITELFAFSVFEVLIGLAIVSAIVAIVLWIRALRRKKYLKFAKSVVKTLTIVFSVILVYTLTASFSYNRTPLEKELPAHSGEVENQEIAAMVDYFLQDLNTLAESFERDEDGNVISPYSFEELSDKMRDEYKKLDSNNYFNTYTPRAKRFIASDIVSLFGILGVSFQPTGEANINSNTAGIHMPQLIAHEFAHSKGVMRENDAELLAAYITLTSDDPYIRYSGYASYFWDIRNMLGLHEMDYETAQVHPLFIKEINNAYKKYNSYRTFIDDIGTAINDIYLKLSGVEDGVGSYQIDGEIIIIIPDDGGEPIRQIVYSPIQRLAQSIYYSQGAP